MEINVKDPETGMLLQLHVKPEQRHGVHGFRIRQPNHSGFFIANRSGVWRVMDDHHVESELLVNIGLALEGHPIEEQTDNTSGLNRGTGTEDREVPGS